MSRNTSFIYTHNRIGSFTRNALFLNNKKCTCSGRAGGVLRICMVTTASTPSKATTLSTITQLEVYRFPKTDPTMTKAGTATHQSCHVFPNSVTAILQREAVIYCNRIFSQLLFFCYKIRWRWCWGWRVLMYADVCRCVSKGVIDVQRLRFLKSYFCEWVGTRSSFLQLEFREVKKKRHSTICMLDLSYPFPPMCPSPLWSIIRASAHQPQSHKPCTVNMQYHRNQNRKSRTDYDVMRICRHRSFILSTFTIDEQPNELTNYQHQASQAYLIPTKKYVR